MANKYINPPSENKTTDPRTTNVWSSWAVTLGIMGIMSGAMCFLLFDLPAGLFLGIGGIAMAFQSKKGQPFSKQAKLGIILSAVSIAMALILYSMIVYSFYVLKTNPNIASLVSQFYNDMETLGFKAAYDRFFQALMAYTAPIS